MVNFGVLLGRKYDILQQQADTARLGMQASANLDTVKAGLLPGESKAGIGLTNAQTTLAGANARNVDEQTKYVAPIAEAGIGETRNRGRYFGAQATGEEQLNTLTPLFKPRGMQTTGGATSIEELVRNAIRMGLGPLAGAQ